MKKKKNEARQKLFFKCTASSSSHVFISLTSSTFKQTEKKVKAKILAHILSLKRSLHSHRNCALFLWRLRLQDRKKRICQVHGYGGWPRNKQVSLEKTRKCSYMVGSFSCTRATYRGKTKACNLGCLLLTFSLDMGRLAQWAWMPGAMCTELGKSRSVEFDGNTRRVEKKRRRRRKRRNESRRHLKSREKRTMAKS